MKGERGVKVRLEGLGAEKLLNVLWKEGIYLTGIRRTPKRGVEVTVPQAHFHRVGEEAREKGFQMTVLSASYQQKIKKALRKRWGIGAGMAAGLCLAVFMLSCVWQVEMVDAGKYAGEVRLFLEEKNIRPWMRQKDVDTTELQEQLLWRLPEVKWVFVKMTGVKLQVKLEEGVAARQEKEGSGDIVAAMDGVMERLTVFSGTAMCKEGDVVHKGQVLIKGEETDKDGQVRRVQAQGQAMARVWVRESIRMRTDEMMTTPTGRMEERVLFQTPFGVYTFEKEPDYLMADREYTAYPLPGAWVPVTVIRERMYECSGEWTERNMQEVALEGEKAAKEALVRAWPETADLDKTTKISMIERGTIEVAAFAQMTKDIAQYGNQP